MNDVVARLRERLTAHIDTQREQIDKLIRENVALTARVEELEKVVNEALTKVENDRTMWSTEWLIWKQDAHAAITKGESHD